MKVMRHHVVAGAHLREIRARVQPGLERELATRGFRFGDPVCLRVFKESGELEAWLRLPGGEGRPYALFKTFPVRNWGGGTLGPKLQEGDGQAPTGFYAVTRGQMKPDSDYHLAFNLGFPNAFDTLRGRNGSFLMVHGGESSIGCYAMTDALIEEIYLLVDAALENGHVSVPVHVFPFRMTDGRMARAASDAGEKGWLDEWGNLKQGYDWFERNRMPPEVTVAADGCYHFR